MKHKSYVEAIMIEVWPGTTLPPLDVIFIRSDFSNRSYHPSRASFLRCQRAQLKLLEREG